MSLMAWYPLIGNTKNYGAGPLTPTVGTAPTYVAAGKIGQCMSTGSLTWTAAQTSVVLNNKAISIAFWIKPVTTSSGAIFGNTGMGASNNRKFTIYAYPSGNDLHWSWMNDAASATFTGGTMTGILPANTWTHVCLTYDNPNGCVYINGELKKTFSGESNSSSFSYATTVIHNSANRYLNDFRVYNHALSAKEVRLISQALVAHYPLRDPGVEAATNLATYPTPGNSITTSYDWDQSLHPNAISVSGWGSGYNGGVSTPTSGYHAHWQLIDGIPTMVFPNLNSVANLKGRWLGISGSSGIEADIGAGGVYTVSFDAKASIDGMTLRGGYYYRITGGTGNSFHDGQTDFTLSTSWKRYSYTYTTKSTMNTSVNGQFYFYGHYGIEGTSYVRNVQIETKDHASAYTKNSRTPKAMDCSGFNNHGAIIGSLTASNNSARNEYSTVFNGSGAVACGRNAMVTDALTVSMWAYMSDWSKFNGMRLASCTESGGWNFENVGHFICYANGAYQRASGNFSSLSAGWHMITGTFDGKQAKIYVDGILKASSTALSTSSLITYNANNGIFIGAEAAGSTTSPGGSYFTGQLSDFRIYATALSAESILNLYEARISMTDKADAMAFEFREDGPVNLKFTETGIIRTGNVSEVGPILGMKMKVLDDGSAWARIHWLDVSSVKTYFANSAEVTYCVDKVNRFSRMDIVEQLKTSSGVYEFMLTYPSLSTALYNRWKQTSSPNATAVTGFTAVTTAWSAHNAGIRKHGSACLYNCDSGSTWYAPIGQYSAWTSTQAIPAANSSSQTETELWVRIDNLPELTKLSMFDNKYIQAFNIYEF